jgi:hypothetical protein
MPVYADVDAGALSSASLNSSSPNTSTVFFHARSVMRSNDTFLVHPPENPCDSADRTRLIPPFDRLSVDEPLRFGIGWKI